MEQKITQQLSKISCMTSTFSLGRDTVIETLSKRRPKNTLYCDDPLILGYTMLNPRF